MNYLRLLEDYMRKSRLAFSITAIALIFPLVIISCADNDTNTNLQAQAHTEQDFVSNPNLAAHPDRKVVVIDLESDTAEEPENLTGELGFDVIPFNYTDATKQTFCWEDPQLDSEHLMKLFDSQGQELAAITSNGECSTVTLVPGRYEMHLFHDNRSDDIHTVFIMPNVSENETAKHLPKSGGLSMLDSSRTSQAQNPTPSPTEFSNLKKLINTNNCEGCDLRYTYMTGSLDSCPVGYDPNDPDGGGFFPVSSDFFINISHADLTGATIEDTSHKHYSLLWCYASMVETNFTSATIANTTLFASTMSSADLSNSSIDSVSFFGSTLSGVKFTDATVSNSSFNTADMSPDIDNHDQGTEFTRAWVDGSDFQYVLGIKTVGFYGAKLTNCTFSGLDLAETFLFSSADLTESNLSSTNLSNTVMMYVTFDKVNFENADLSNFECVLCTFTGANFKGATVTGSTFDATGAIWTDGTCVCQDASCSNC